MLTRKRRLVKYWVLLAVVLFLILARYLIVCFLPENREVVVKATFYCPYDYIVYEDHVALEQYCGNKTNVKIPNRLWNRPVTLIDLCCFCDNLKVEQVAIPDTVVEIKGCAFKGCENLSSVLGGKNIKRIGENGFGRRYNLSEFQPGENLESIENFGFLRCSSLKDISFSNQAVTIGAGGFSYTAVEEIPEWPRLEDHRGGFLRDTPWLKKQTADFITINGVLHLYQGDQTVVRIPDGIIGISDAFSLNYDNMTEVKEIYIPESVTDISQSSFFFQKEVTIYIPASVKTMGGVSLIQKKSKLFLEDNCKIVTTSGSPIEAYAKTKGIPYELVDDWEKVKERFDAEGEEDGATCQIK